jgi:hypothetical protein
MTNDDLDQIGPLLREVIVAYVRDRDGLPDGSPTLAGPHQELKELVGSGSSRREVRCAVQRLIADAAAYSHVMAAAAGCFPSDTTALQVIESVNRAYSIREWEQRFGESQ